jgi:hypothetical protein
MKTDFVYQQSTPWRDVALAEAAQPSTSEVTADYADENGLF